MNKMQSFNDGVAKIYEMGNISEPGNMPKQGLVEKTSTLRYSEEKVGITRFYTGMQAKVKVDRLLRFPKIKNVSTQDILVEVITEIKSEHYKITQIQYPKDVYPLVMDLSLERIEAKYDIS